MRIQAADAKGVEPKQNQGPFLKAVWGTREQAHLSYRKQRKKKGKVK